MNLPTLEHPGRYTGLYVVDFNPSTSLPSGLSLSSSLSLRAEGRVEDRTGGTCAVGYTAGEVAMLLESEAYAHVKIYRINGARPDGTMELAGVPGERFRLETGLFFYSRDSQTARREYDEILHQADGHLPCRAQLLLGEFGEGVRLPRVVGLAYPAEYDEDISRWMLDNDVALGERADGGAVRLEAIRRDARIIDSAQLHAVKSRQTRTRQEVFAGIGEPIQRIA